VALLAHDDARDLRDVLARVVEEHEVHHGIAVVVAFEFFLELLPEFLDGIDVVVGEVVVERREAEELRVLLVEVLTDVRVLDVLLDDVRGELELLLDIAFGDQTVAVDALALVYPEFRDFVRVLVVLRFRLQDAEEDAGQMADVELVVEVGRGLFEFVGDLLVENESAFAETFGFVEHVFVEVFEVVGHERLVDADHGLVVGQHDLQDPEVAHEARVDVEDARSRVHR